MIQNVVVNHLPFSVAFGVLLPSFMLSGRSKFLNTFKKGIYKIVMLQVFLPIFFFFAYIRNAVSLPGQPVLNPSLLAAIKLSRARSSVSLDRQSRLEHSSASPTLCAPAAGGQPPRSRRVNFHGTVCWALGRGLSVFRAK